MIDVNDLLFLLYLKSPQWRWRKQYSQNSNYNNVMQVCFPNLTILHYDILQTATMQSFPFYFII